MARVSRNFRIPEELDKHLEKKSLELHCNKTEYLIRLIVADLQEEEKK